MQKCVTFAYFEREEKHHNGLFYRFTFVKRKVRTTQSTAPLNGWAFRKKRQKVSQKITALIRRGKGENVR